jgi:gamma-glutamylcyclotransferase (GGCT)/AIG2-like uncharacterized protein YtfP
MAPVLTPSTAMTEERLPVFVYGTLRPGEKNYLHYLAGRTVDEVSAMAEGQLYFVADGGYPYVEPGPGLVSGELIYLDPQHYEETLQAVDELEEYNPDDEAHSAYLRRRTTVFLADGNPAAAWIYYWNCPSIAGIRISSGDFLNRPA